MATQLSVGPVSQKAGGDMRFINRIRQHPGQHPGQHLDQHPDQHPYQHPDQHPQPTHMALVRQHLVSVEARTGMDSHVVNQGAVAGMKVNGIVSASHQQVTTCVEPSKLSSWQSKGRMST